ncbi:alpha-2-macroglobulin family protein [Capnocytophaga catalasegens]|uniref:Membrane protein n=1 Tax=Capnocytophaga catalasegens TaxID=1004260 RepID=A0AAV5AZN5_9FLAO|nr:MG2 domain-containing protein [Capnocytophaga catalasegens]GIZ16542.1 membrane protein [Capnocytophaga catalasegens]GJM51571.1 membrane protein [Capnocytophaga catalasegens]GJM54004.1 membrane protein [Capnocytophaga catalasegens]
MKNILRLSFLAIFVLFACSTDKEQDSNPLLFKEYISGFSSGYISAYDPIRVIFTSAISEEKTKEISASKLFDISPNVKGKLVLTGNEVQFVPENSLNPDTEYQVTLNLFRLFDVKDKKLERFRFRVRTFESKFTVETHDLQSYSKEYYFLNASLVASDNISSNLIKDLVSAEISGKKLSVKTSFSGSNNRIPIIIDSIPALREEQTLVISWNGKKHNIDSKGETSLTIPSQDVFDVIQLIKDDDNANSFSIGFSAPLAKNQDFRGFVWVDDKSDFKYSVSGNTLKVYSEEDFENTIKVSVNQGLRSSYGERMSTNFTGELTFEQQKPEVRFVRNGTILPSSQNLKINFQTINLKAVEVTVSRIYQNNILQFLQENSLKSGYNIYKVGTPLVRKIIPIRATGLTSLKKWNTHALDLSTLILPEPGAIYRVEIAFNRKFSLYCGTNTEPILEETISISDDDNNYSNYDNDDDSEYYEDDYNYVWEERDDPCKDSYYYGKKITTNVLASDLGVIVKRGQNNDYTIVVNNLLTTKPVNGALVEMYDFQQQKIQSGATNGEGILQLTTNKKAYFAVVQKDNYSTYVKIDDGNSQSVSRYDVDGVSLEKGRNGYIYTERGVWRPGDSILVGFILNDFANKLPENHPIKLTFTDPFGKVMQQMVKNSTKENHYLFTLKTNPESVTGNWNCQIKVGASVFNKTIKIETIKPHRLKIQNSLADKLIKSSGGNVSVQVDWLQGTPAGNTGLEVTAKLYRTSSAFKGFEGYTFENVSTPFASEEISVYNGKTNENGQASFFFQPDEIENASGMLRVNFLTKANETGGDFSIDVSSAMYSPFKSYVGMKAPEPNRYGYYETKQKHPFQVVVVSEEGKPLANQPVKLYGYKMEYSWWWDASYSNISSYNASDSHTAQFELSATTNKNGKAFFDINIDNDNWGAYYLLVENENSGHQAGFPVRFDWSYGTRKDNNSQEAVMLALGTNKTEYAVSEKVEINFPSDEGGRALISIENGSKVLQTYWVETARGETKYSLPITEDMAPNAYIYVTLLQPHAQTENDSPIRLYGIAPISVYNAKTKLEPVITMDEVLRPEKKTTIKVKEKSERPMTYTIAIVEDGLLDLTRFKTPKPWERFFAKTALGVKTWDIYNDVIGAFGGTINQVFSIGGDEDLGASQAQKANRFKPLVIVQGPFYTSGGSKSHEITLPNYIGSARVMVIASDVEKNAFGSAEKTVPVRSPLMILGSLPRKATPGESITLPVTVFAMEKQIKNVSVRVKTDSKFKLTSNAEQHVSFSQVPSEKMAYFNLQVNDLGIGKITIEATSGGERATYEVEMDVYNPNPRMYQIKQVVLSGKSSENVSFEVFGEKGTNATSIEASSFPGINLNQRLKYLIEYPHGCGEQITSGAFPQLYLADFSKLSDKQKQDVQKNVSSAIRKLSENQLSDGGFSYWKGGKYADQWVTSYIGQFYIEAEKRGFSLPMNAKTKWLDYQKKQARSWQPSQYDYYATTQAYRLYTLALANHPEMASMNRLRETPQLSNEAIRLLAASYALAGQKRTAEELFGKVSLDNSDENYTYTYGSATRSQAMSLETALLLGKNQIASDLALKISEKLSSSDWLSTQTAAYSLYAMAGYATKNKSGKDWVLSFSIGNNSGTLQSDTGYASQDVSANIGTHSVKLQNKSDRTLYVRLVSSGKLPVGPAGKELAQQNGLSIISKYVDAKGNTISVEEIAQGTTFTNVISITNTTQSKVDNVALTQLIPSGWEIINTRFTEYGGEQNGIDFADIRDDRTNLYFSLRANETKTFRIQLNASFAGRYYLPGTYAEAMYDQRYNTRNIDSWVSVK